MVGIFDLVSLYRERIGPEKFDKRAWRLVQIAVLTAVCVVLYRAYA